MADCRCIRSDISKFGIYLFDDVKRRISAFNGGEDPTGNSGKAVEIGIYSYGFVCQENMLVDHRDGIEFHARNRIKVTSETIRFQKSS